ncbi:MAG TPA: response regulator [Thermoanaerobaculia bacterium]|jgi:DNA-binding response OmpR family regulator|nr:response regulator [Thermoanaerobaculia bacterium]
MDPVSTASHPILVIDDHDDTRNLLVELLEIEGFTVLGAASGEQALALVRSHRPCMILLDLGLPDIAGLELVLRLRAEANGAGTPIYALSGFTNLRSAALAAGIDGFLIKPVLGSELRGIVAQHCAPPPPPAALTPMPIPPSA